MLSGTLFPFMIFLIIVAIILGILWAVFGGISESRTAQTNQTRAVRDMMLGAIQGEKAAKSQHFFGSDYSRPINSGVKAKDADDSAKGVTLAFNGSLRDSTIEKPYKLAQIK